MLIQTLLDNSFDLAQKPRLITALWTIYRYEINIFGLFCIRIIIHLRSYSGIINRNIFLKNELLAKKKKSKWLRKFQCFFTK